MKIKASRQKIKFFFQTVQKLNLITLRFKSYRTCFGRKARCVQKRHSTTHSEFEFFLFIKIKMNGDFFYIKTHILVVITRRFSEWRFRNWQNGGQILTYWWFSDFSFWKKSQIFFPTPHGFHLKTFPTPYGCYRKDSYYSSTPHGVFLPLAGADF